jgi:hypothetical protein
MSDIVEILGEKKFIGSKRKELKTRVVFEENKKIQYEHNLFYDISQQTQYITEKNESNKFRIYGKINPIINLNVHQKLTNNTDRLIEIDNNLFDMNLNNWTIVVLKSKRFESKVDVNGIQQYIKGVKKLEKSSNNTTIIDLDFRLGLPARQYNSSINSDNFCMFLPLGHNFEIGDKLKVETLDDDLLDSKIYDVVDVRPNMVYINTKPVKRSFKKQIVQAKEASTKKIDDFTNVKVNNTEVANNDAKQRIKNLVFKPSEIPGIINTPRPRIQSLIRPEFYVSKIIEKEQLEYYVKGLEIIAIVDQLDDCAFSINNYNQQIKNFFLNGDLNITGLRNNLNEPLSDLYIGIIKNSAPAENTISNVESHFSNYIENVGDGFGLELISDNTKGFNSKPKIGDILLHSICEHTTENLTENEISYISHRFIYKNVLFNYKPFTKINIKLKSPYIEDGENVRNKPDYAIYSREREKYIWRDVFDIGITDENGNVIDFPFMNGSFYTFCDINFFLTPEVRSVRKYTLNVNDVTSAAGNQFINEFDDAFRNVDLSETNDPNDPNGIKPFNQYRDEKC